MYSEASICNEKSKVNLAMLKSENDALEKLNIMIRKIVDDVVSALNAEVELSKKPVLQPFSFIRRDSEFYEFIYNDYKVIIGGELGAFTRTIEIIDITNKRVLKSVLSDNSSTVLKVIKSACIKRKSRLRSV